jgi:hypothetical protein
MLFPTSEPVPSIIRFLALAMTFVLRTFQSLTELTEAQRLNSLSKEQTAANKGSLKN